MIKNFKEFWQYTLSSILPTMLVSGIGMMKKREALEYMHETELNIRQKSTIR